MSNSKLATVHYWTKNYSSRNGKKISKIIIHHMAGNLDAKGCYNVWKNRQGSAHYAISSKGEIGQLIDEKYRAWSVANAAADSIAVTMELANDGGAKTNWHVSDKAIAKCIDLCVDICQRNGISKLNFTGNSKGNLVMHRYYMATACPGAYLAGKFKYIASEVNKRLAGSKPTPAPTSTLYRVRKTWADAKSQVGAYKVLENAKKVADSKGLNVYDDKGTLVYQSKKKVDNTLYRVRKTWADTKSQVGAYKSLANAKKECDKHAGFSVYDESGKAVYTSPKPKHKLIVKADEYCYPYGTASSKYAYKTGSAKSAYKTALKKFMGKTAKVSQTDCGYFVSTCVRASGVSSTFLALPANSKKAYPAVPSTMKIVHKGKAIPSGLLQAGDIIRYRKTSGGQHTMIYYGDGKIAEAQRSSATTGKNYPAIKKDTQKYNASNVKKSTIQVIRIK